MRTVLWRSAIGRCRLLANKTRLMNGRSLEGRVGVLQGGRSWILNRAFLEENRRSSLCSASFCSVSTSEKDDSVTKFDLKLLLILACPLDKSVLYYSHATHELVNPELGVAYPIRDGIPCLVPTDARRIDEDELKEMVLERPKEDDLKNDDC